MSNWTTNTSDWRAAEQITYRNQSPHPLSYLWLQLDANMLAPDSDAALTANAPSLDRLSTDALTSLRARETFDGSLTITEVSDSNKIPLRHTIVKTMMRVDLRTPAVAGRVVCLFRGMELSNQQRQGRLRPHGLRVLRG